LRKGNNREEESNTMAIIAIDRSRYQNEEKYNSVDNRRIEDNDRRRKSQKQQV
jgi:hypothetical protein